ncbi:MAG: T9SS type A sorting domain-containing protein [Prevotella sp.]|jgi:hypothetical protein|nr:T9SS type A sorting domain-containing protein [Prevotella sp.]
MKKIIWLYALCFCFNGLFAQSISRVEGSPYPAAASTTDRLYLTSESFSYSQKITLQSLQGMLARTKPEILRDAHGHADILGNYVTIDRSYYNNFSGLLARYAGRFSGYILCDARASSVNVAFSLCAPLNAIAVPADVEQQAVSAGYAKVLDVRGKDEAWALANYGGQLSRTIASYQAVNDDRALYVGDYSAFAGALQFWDDSATGTLANTVYSRMNPCAVYFGWGAGEYATVEQISQRSAMIHPSDWSPNLSVLSNIPAKLPRQKTQPTEYKVVENVHAVCFVITDGDNIQWLSGSLNNTGNWANPDKARLNLGWTVSPAFAELAPALYRKYIENALTTDGARNYLVAGPSGAGYYFPSIYPQLAAQTSFMNRILKKADLNIVNIIDKDGNHNPDEYLKQSNVDALFYYSYGSQYQGLNGAIKWYKDKPSIGGRFTLWGNSDDGSAETRERVCKTLADKLNSQSTNIRSASGYSLIPVHIWTMGPSDVLNCINKLNANVRVVSPDEFVWLVRKNVKMLNIGNGNGIKAEYTLASDPSAPVLTANEPTVDLDDEYLTDGTEAVGTNNFTVRWTGKVQTMYSQQYTFHTSATGGVSLKINGRTLCDSLNNASVTAADTITLQAGKQYDLEVVYKKTGTKASCLLEWESASQVRQRIPRYQLFSQPMPGTGLVTAYDTENYGGYSSSLKVGEYTAAALARAGFEAQTLKSLKITDGFRVTLYDADNFGGDSQELDADNANLGEWITRTVSLRVTTVEPALPDGVYFIKPTTGNNIMGIDGGYQNSANGQKARLMRNSGNTNMQFRFTRQGSYYRIEVVSNGRSLEIADFSRNDAAAVQQWKTSDADNQKFIVVPADEAGVYRIYSYFSEKIIAPESSASSALICQKSVETTPNALWKLEAVPALPNGNGNGLTAQYYNGANFNTLHTTQIDTVVNFNWGTASPMRGVSADNFSIRWQGKIEPRATGEYTFFVNSDNGRRLWVNDQLLIDKWIDDYDIEYSGNISLQASQRYDIKLDYFESDGAAYCYLEWESPRQLREIVPRSQLYSLDYNGIENTQTNGRITLYPNPANDVITLSAPSGVSQSFTAVIADLSGRIVASIEGRYGEPADISGLSEGMYFISLTNTRFSIPHKLIIKR